MFSINRKNPANLNYHMSIKKSGCFLVLRKLLLVSFCVVVWVLFSVFSIFCITSLVSVTPRNHQKSQAILKRFKDLKFSVWLIYAGIRKRNLVFWHLELFSASSFLFLLSRLISLSISRKDQSDSASRVEKSWPVVDLKKVLSVTKHDFVFWAQRKPNAKPFEIYKAFQNRLAFLNQYMIV